MRQHPLALHGLVNVRFQYSRNTLFTPAIVVVSPLDAPACPMQEVH